jgi:hypothetical protein
VGANEVEAEAPKGLIVEDELFFAMWIDRYVESIRSIDRTYASQSTQTPTVADRYQGASKADQQNEEEGLRLAKPPPRLPFQQSCRAEKALILGWARPQRGSRIEGPLTTRD